MFNTTNFCDARNEVIGTQLPALCNDICDMRIVFSADSKKEEARRWEQIHRALLLEKLKSIEPLRVERGSRLT